MAGNLHNNTKQFRELKRRCKAALREAMRLLAVKKREAMVAENKARIREKRAYRLAQKVSQLEYEAKKARSQAEVAVHAVEMAREQVDRQLAAVRDADKALHEAGRVRRHGKNNLSRAARNGTG